MNIMNNSNIGHFKYTKNEHVKNEFRLQELMVPETMEYKEGEGRGKMGYVDSLDKIFRDFPENLEGEVFRSPDGRRTLEIGKKKRTKRLNFLLTEKDANSERKFHLYGTDYTRTTELQWIHFQFKPHLHELFINKDGKWSYDIDNEYWSYHYDMTPALAEFIYQSVREKLKAEQPLVLGLPAENGTLLFPGKRLSNGAQSNAYRAIGIDYAMTNPNTRSDEVSDYGRIKVDEWINGDFFQMTKENMANKDRPDLIITYLPTFELATSKSPQSDSRDLGLKKIFEIGGMDIPLIVRTAQQYGYWGIEKDEVLSNHLEEVIVLPNHISFRKETWNIKLYFLNIKPTMDKGDPQFDKYELKYRNQTKKINAAKDIK